MKQGAILVARRRSQTIQVWNSIFAEHAMPCELSHPVFNCRFGFIEFDLAEGSDGVCRVPECPQRGPYYQWFSRKSALHEISPGTGGKQVLTFFEYLRRRAFESIVEGAQEAVDFLEAKTERRSSNETKKAHHRQTRRTVKDSWRKVILRFHHPDVVLVRMPRTRNEGKRKANRLRAC
jgi:hypothetical protein